MTASSLQLLPVPAGESCARCDAEMMLTPDAVGRLRKRCPKCDGVSLKRLRHPDDLMMPQALVQVKARPALPEIEPGQLRCQRCAHGVRGNDRYCADCSAVRKRPPCVRCHRVFTRARKWQKICGDCVTVASPTVRVCAGCNRLSPRPKHGRPRVMRCSYCRPRPEPSPVQTCLGCGATYPRAKGRKFTIFSCSACPPKPRRAAKPRAEPKVHPRSLPSDHPRKIEWLAQRKATRAAHGPAAYTPKACAKPDCGVLFQPTGPAAKYCEAHR